jgi:ubiquinone/menaquinone biosynthesis C-methylase UbiE
LNVDDFVKRFEIDNREVYAARNEILKAIDLKPGQRIVDVGAGTGLYTRLFAQLAGEQGWVFAVDISPKFIQHINDTVKASDLHNVTSVLCQHDSIDLPPESVDIVYVCDTYHHFEHPAETSGSIYRSLKDGGQLVVVDFERIPGKSRDWILGHVRAGKETVRSEIEAAGFKFVEETEIPGMEENYFLRFEK